VGPVAVRVAVRGDPLVDLEDLGLDPGHLRVLGQQPEHRPGAGAPADRERKGVALGDRGARGLGDQLRSARGGGLGIGQDFDAQRVALGDVGA
jgi:hypothetical protein